ncbi:serine/threonine protein kinase [Stanieria cyanosphaera PCC 7437]|uniref:Serine/threonine protein kinase n=1 Tax=Stanieria cyanosphaera (strain ATCC 29371 / PCC 7437) TaxID=111780 RepID=K9XTK7_STAC7|nr:serine/threonine-protein kinase [Stanieria cyanosphaera]AFZ35873.1 serine/threonine protein kinase [Stanieria cyanosphaera PCC 7437]
MINILLKNRYLIQQQLGKRGGRETFLAQDQITQQLVVIKFLKFGLDFEWEHLKLFEREAQTLQNISHPAIAQYLDYFEIDLPNCQGFALVQSYIQAQSLTEQIQQGRNFSESEVKQIAAKILEILIYLHNRKPPIIHRDIKPSNILLTKSFENNIGEIYLIDFGSVQNVVAREGGTITIVGTYGYMPPEQFGDRCVPASDLYSLGATLIYLITGIQPADLPQQEGKIQFETGVNLSIELTAWLRKMTEPSLDKRFNSAQLALQELNNPSKKYQNNIVISQPIDSQINLYKTQEKIEITVPPAGFNPGLIGLTTFAIAWNSFIAFWTYNAVFIAPFPINIIFGLFSLPFWTAGLGMVGGILFTLFGKKKLIINQQRIAFIYQLFQFKYQNPKPSPTAGIIKIQRHNYLHLQNSDSESTKFSPTLQIWVGKNKYQLDSLSEPELDWLAQELSDWLNLPIVRD